MDNGTIDNGIAIVKEQLNTIWGINNEELFVYDFPKIFKENIDKLSKVVRFSSGVHVRGLHGIVDKDNDFLHSIRVVFLARYFLQQILGNIQKNIAIKHLFVSVENLLYIHDLPEIISGDVAFYDKYKSGYNVDPKEHEAAKIVFGEGSKYLEQWETFEIISTYINKKRKCPSNLSNRKYFEISLIACVFDILDGNVFYHYHLSAEECFEHVSIYQVTIGRIEGLFKFLDSLRFEHLLLYGVILDILLKYIEVLHPLWMDKAPEKQKERLRMQEEWIIG